LPIFWTYHADDRRTGVTIHHASERLDAGDIILQQGFELARGYPAAALDADMAERAAPLLCEAVEQLGRGRAPRVAQDEGAATRAPVIERGVPMVDFDRWDVERVWHFLAALCPRYREPLVDDAGTPVMYERVEGFNSDGSRGDPGRALRCDDGWVLHCRGGTVKLAKRK
jgi:methionyl-tRNA formyltransferase